MGLEKEAYSHLIYILINTKYSDERITKEHNYDKELVSKYSSFYRSPISRWIINNDILNTISIFPNQITYLRDFKKMSFEEMGIAMKVSSTRASELYRESKELLKSEGEWNERHKYLQLI